MCNHCYYQKYIAMQKVVFVRTIFTNGYSNLMVKWFLRRDIKSKVATERGQNISQRCHWKSLFLTSVPDGVAPGESTLRFFRGPMAASAVRLASRCRIWANSCCCICRKHKDYKIPYIRLSWSTWKVYHKSDWISDPIFSIFDNHNNLL